MDMQSVGQTDSRCPLLEHDLEEGEPEEEGVEGRRLDDPKVLGDWITRLEGVLKKELQYEVPNIMKRNSNRKLEVNQNHEFSLHVKEVTRKVTALYQSMRDAPLENEEASRKFQSVLRLQIRLKTLQETLDRNIAEKNSGEALERCCTYFGRGLRVICGTMLIGMLVLVVRYTQEHGD